MWVCVCACVCVLALAAALARHRSAIAQNELYNWGGHYLGPRLVAVEARGKNVCSDGEDAAPPDTSSVRAGELAGSVRGCRGEKAEKAHLDAAAP